MVAFGAVDTRGSLRVFVANLTSRRQSIRVAGGEPLTLASFACVAQAVAGGGAGF